MSDDTTTSLIAARADFKLYHRPERGDRGWQNFKLVLTTRRAPKHNWHLGWNPLEQRLARNRDHYLLRERYPTIYAWLVSELRQRPATEPVELVRSWLRLTGTLCSKVSFPENRDLTAVES